MLEPGKESTGQQHVTVEHTLEAFAAAYSGLFWPAGREFSFTDVMQASYAIYTW